MTDPVFETRAELKAWVKRQLAYREPGRRELHECKIRILRVTLAHSHLPFEPCADRA